MNLKEWLFRKGLKQLHIAKESGIRASTLSKFLNGWEDLPKKHEQNLCKVLGLTPKELYGDFSDKKLEK